MIFYIFCYFITMYVLCNFLFNKILPGIIFNKFQNINIYISLYINPIDKLFYLLDTNILFKSIVELLYDTQSAYLPKSIGANQNTLS